MYTKLPKVVITVLGVVCLCHISLLVHLCVTFAVAYLSVISLLCPRGHSIYNFF